MTGASGDATTIAVVDYGMGNRRSVEKALEHIGARAIVSSDPQMLRAADGLIVPGVGSFPRAMQNLRERGLDQLLRERVAAATPLLGVCLGLQVLFERSTEHDGADGLGILAGSVQALRATSLKLPHIGWNEVRFTRASPLTRELPQRSAFYHVHSFAPVPERGEDILGVADYGAPFVSAVARESVYGVQFHPEKSSAAGLRLLANFASICSRSPALSHIGGQAGR
jgi:imidazole glycerol-phosphate synthase subunit HisH